MVDDNVMILRPVCRPRSTQKVASTTRQDYDDDNDSDRAVPEITM
jgi:hypothetical protein